MVTKARSTVLLATLVSTFALVVACSSDDVSIPPPAGSNDAGPTTTTDSSSNSDGSGAGDTGTTTDSGQDSGPIVTTPIVDADCAAFGDAYCDLAGRCFPVLLGGLDQTTCKARAGLGCAIAVQAPSSAKAPQTCSTAIKAALCTSNLSDIDPSCHVKGTIADGGVCEFDGQCQSGSCPKKGVTGPCSTCKARALENASCQAADCDYGLQCAEGTCVKPVAKDGACTKGKCAPPNRCVAGTCQVPKATNDGCTTVATFDDPCDAVHGDYCKPPAVAGQGTCTSILYADPGQSCGIVNGGLTGCKGLAQCKQGKCVANAADGAACNTTSGPGCSGPAECINGVCTFPKPDRCK